MRVSPNMNLLELAFAMGGNVTPDHARAMRDELVRLRPGCDTDSIWAGEWDAMIHRAAIFAEA